jgi:hypothetical protein
VLIEPIETVDTLPIDAGVQHAFAAFAVSALSTGASLKTGILSKVWNVSQGIPDGSLTQYLSDLA